MADWYRHVSMGLDGVVCQVEAELSSGKMHVRGWRGELGQTWFAYRSHLADDVRIEFEARIVATERGLEGRALDENEVEAWGRDDLHVPFDAGWLSFRNAISVIGSMPGAV